MAATARKTYPAKAAAGRRKTTLPASLDMQVTKHAGTWHVQALKKATSSTTSASHAVARLAKLLGYSVHADVRYLRATEGGLLFQIVEVQPCTQ